MFAANRPRGLPIGNLTSQFWANCYLDAFDYFVKRELGCRGYVRYVDDFLLFANDKRALSQWRAAILKRLMHLRLTLHERAAQPRPVTEGISFLGFCLFPTHRRLKSRVGLAFRRRWHTLLSAYARREINLTRVTMALNGWLNHARSGDTYHLRRAVVSVTIHHRSA